MLDRDDLIERVNEAINQVKEDIFDETTIMFDELDVQQQTKLDEAVDTIVDLMLELSSDD